MRKRRIRTIIEAIIFERQYGPNGTLLLPLEQSLPQVLKTILSASTPFAMELIPNYHNTMEILPNATLLPNGAVCTTTLIHLESGRPHTTTPSLL